MQLEDVRKEKGDVESFKLISLFQLLQNDAKQDWEGVEGSGEGLPPPLILHSQLRYCVWLKLCTTIPESQEPRGHIIGANQANATSSPHNL